ncbi:HlyD family secretion protein [Albidovulum inexpectatum]|uniref:HlyD family secretion protein n=1 Tax=Albidovulum inexpectatum TaxID=196587 RepID=A0A2S5JGQ9_9RHOB|nr:HlyD family efflux transporter periplasmic adaptor subunit [Albidovulum inexpectatum]PPB80696.1 HlyD family secretion protein [Albidovulum inexpectatum]
MAGLICAIPIVSQLLSACAPPGPIATGYVEGEFLLIAPVATAQIDVLEVERGDTVSTGDVLARMERRDAQIALAEANSALAQAESRLADLRAGRRPEEIRVVEAELASARAQAAEAERAAIRLRELFQRGAAAQSQLDDAETRAAVARARVAEVEANLAVARLPARAHEIAAAEAAVAQARARRDAAAWQLDQRTLTAPAPGRVDEILRRAGEIAGPQAPILSILPDGGALLRLYVSEPDLARIAPGVRLVVNCDGCPPGSHATVTYVSDEPEFTPPVIYSLENRQKLVWLVEARPDRPEPWMKPGQIVDVALAGDE